MVAGYAFNGAGMITLQRGNPDAFAPADDSVFARMQQGYNPASLLPEADVYAVPVSPDFLVTGNFTHDSEKDVLFAAKGGALYLMAGDGSGRLGGPQADRFAGTSDGIGCRRVSRCRRIHRCCRGCHGTGGESLLIFDAARRDSRTRWPSSRCLRRASAIEFGGLDDDPFMDVAVAAGSEILVVHGWGRKEQVAAASREERFNVGAGLRGLAVGEFAWDRDRAH